MESQPQPAAIPIPKTDAELADLAFQLTGIRVASKACCKDHVAPLQALADAYFARYPVTVWEASRAFGGKSVLLALLVFLEACTYGAACNLLGGSGEQSGRVHGYMTGEDTNLPGTFWGNAGAPRYLLLSDPSHYTTRLSNGGRIRVLTASTKSVRGPHPQRLRCDEVDEMSMKVYRAASGQTMGARGIQAQTVLSSTHQYPLGTFTEVKSLAHERGWPIYEWCYKENLEANGGWLPDSEVARKKSEMPKADWEAEVELQEPNPEGRAIVVEKVEAMFRTELGKHAGQLGAYIEFEKPIAGARYATGADWAKERDKTIIVTLRYDIKPARIVAFRHTGRLDWPVMIGYFNEQATLYNSKNAHDATGIGNVIADYLKVKAFPFKLVGDTRSRLLRGYIVAIENGLIQSPYIEYMYREHKFASNNDIYGSGHLPDTICAGAVAWAIARGGGWAIGAAN